MTPPSELDTAPQPNLDPALHAGPSMFSGTAGSENSDEDDLPDDVEMGLRAQERGVKGDLALLLRRRDDVCRQFLIGRPGDADR